VNRVAGLFDVVSSARENCPGGICGVHFSQFDFSDLCIRGSFCGGTGD
jgi:hypothetical protein